MKLFFSIFFSICLSFLVFFYFIEYSSAHGSFLGRTSRWADGNVKIVRDTETITNSQWTLILKAFEQWSAASNNAVTFTEIEPTEREWFLWRLTFFRFVFVTVEEDHYHYSAYTNGTGCGARQKIAVCVSTWRQISDDQIAVNFVLGHEMGHVLGLHHEHQRPDRDSYVIISEKPDYWPSSDWKKEMKKLPSRYFLGGARSEQAALDPFDYDSIMMYGSPEVRKIDGSYLSENYSVSAGDGAKIQRLYK